MASRSIISCVRNQAIRNSLLKSNGAYLVASMSTSSTKQLQIKSNRSSSLSSPINLLKQQQILMLHLSRTLNESIMIESPAFAESINEGGVIFCKKVGESVQADEIVAKIETDKTTIDVPSPKAGVIEALLVEDGSTITAHLPLIKLAVGAAPATAAASAPAATAAAAPAPAPAVAAPPKPTKSVSTTLPEIPPLPKAPVSTTFASQVPVTPLKPYVEQAADINKISGTRAETRVKMSKMRQTVASRLKNAQNTTAMLTTFNEINMGNLVEMRKTYGDAFLKKHNLKLGFMSAFVKSAATALLDQPAVNAVIENNEIVYRDYVDISVAVATPKGLVVPVVRNCEKMSYADIEKEISSLGERARQNKLAIEDMQGGTFTISNGGVFGSLFGTPIINLPQSAILGMHGIFDRPVVVNGQIVIRPMMYVALTYDHRLIDGREAVTFLRKIKSTVEDPRTLLLDV
jgi:2-oxoglutarate dehydrogenase E2 component (dihydrolipoamide succinyltransferase)